MDPRCGIVCLFFLVSVTMGRTESMGKKVSCLTRHDDCNFDNEARMNGVTRVVINPLIKHELGQRPCHGIDVLILNLTGTPYLPVCYWNAYANFAPNITSLQLINIHCGRVSLDMPWHVPQVRGLNVDNHNQQALDNLGGDEELEYMVTKSIDVSGSSKLSDKTRDNRLLDLTMRQATSMPIWLAASGSRVKNLIIRAPNMRRLEGNAIPAITNMTELTIIAPRLQHIGREVFVARSDIKSLTLNIPAYRITNASHPLVTTVSDNLKQLEHLAIVQRGYPSRLLCKYNKLRTVSLTDTSPQNLSSEIAYVNDHKYEHFCMVNVPLTPDTLIPCQGQGALHTKTLEIKNSPDLDPLDFISKSNLTAEVIKLNGPWASDRLILGAGLNETHALSIENLNQANLQLTINTAGVQDIKLTSSRVQNMKLTITQVLRTNLDLSRSGIMQASVELPQGKIKSLNLSGNSLQHLSFSPGVPGNIGIMDVSDNLLVNLPDHLMTGDTIVFAQKNPFNCSQHNLNHWVQNWVFDLTKVPVEPDWLYNQCYLKGEPIARTLAQCMLRPTNCEPQNQIINGSGDGTRPYTDSTPAERGVTTTIKRRDTTGNRGDATLDLGQGAAVYPELGLVFQNMGTLRHSGQSLTLNVIMQAPKLNIPYPQHLVDVYQACHQANESYTKAICDAYVPILQRAVDDAQRLHNLTERHVGDLRTMMLNPQLALRGPNRRPKRFVFTSILGLVGPALLSGATRLASHVIERKRVADLQKGAELILKRQNVMSDELISIRKNLATYATTTEVNQQALQSRIVNVTARMREGQARLKRMFDNLAADVETVHNRQMSIKFLTELTVACTRTQVINVGTYRSMIAALGQLTQAITDLHRGRLNTALMGPNTLSRLVTQASDQLFNWMPEYRLDLESVDQLYNLDSILVLSSSELGILEWQIALPVVKRNAHPLALYKVVPFAVPVTTNTKVTDNGPRLTYASYTIVRPEASYIAFEGDYYVTLTSDEYDQCESSWDASQFRCPFHLIETQRARHTCLSEVFYGGDPQSLWDLCNIDFLSERLPNPTIIQVNDKVILSGLQAPYSLRCMSDSQPRPMASLFFVCMDASVLCNCDIASRTEFVQRQFCVNERMGTLNYTVVPNALAQIAAATSNPVGGAVKGPHKLNWGDINLTQVFNKFTPEDIDDGVPLQSLVKLSQTSSDFVEKDNQLRNKQHTAFESFSLSTMGYITSLVLALVGTLSWIALCLVCARQLSNRQMLTAMTLGQAKGAAASLSLADAAWHSTQHALVTIGVAIVLYLVFWVLKILLSHIGADSAPRLTDNKFSKCPRLTVYLELCNGLQRVMLPVAALHVPLNKVLILGNANPRLLDISKHLCGWHVRFTAFTEQAALQVHGQTMSLPTVVPVPLLYRRKVAQIYRDKPSLTLWLVDTFGIAYQMEGSTATNPRSAQPNEQPPPEYAPSAPAPPGPANLNAEQTAFLALPWRPSTP